MSIGVTSQEINNQMNKLFSSILSEQEKINAVKSADEDKKHLIQETLQDFTALRGKGFYYNYMSSGKGNGPFTELIDGSVKYDMINGIGVQLLGHSHPLFIKSFLEAATSDIMMAGNLQPYREAHQSTKELVNAVSKSRLKHFWFGGSGSFSNDTALKMVWQKMAPKYKLIAFEKAFAGRSVATQNITANAGYREGMPNSMEVEHIPHYDYNDPENALDKTLSALNNVWEKDPNNYCAIMLELVQGEGGFIYGTEEYYKGIFDWARDKGIYIWVDEVQSVGRTHELFAFQMFNLDEYVDIVTVGKALQVCGVLFTEELNPKPGLIAGTFTGSIASLNACSKTVKYLTEGNFYGKNGRIKEIEDLFTSKLKYLSQNSCKGKIGYVGGIGTMLSFEIGDSSAETTKKFLHQLYKNGVIAFSAGRNPVRVRFLVPVILKNEHIDEVISIVEKTILEVIK